MKKDHFETIFQMLLVPTRFRAELEYKDAKALVDFLRARAAR